MDPIFIVKRNTEKLFNDLSCLMGKKEKNDEQYQEIIQLKDQVNNLIKKLENHKI